LIRLIINTKENIYRTVLIEKKTHKHTRTHIHIHTHAHTHTHTSISHQQDNSYPKFLCNLCSCVVCDLQVSCFQHRKK